MVDGSGDIDSSLAANLRKNAAKLRAVAEACPAEDDGTLEEELRKIALEVADAMDKMTFQAETASKALNDVSELAARAFEGARAAAALHSPNLGRSLPPGFSKPLAARSCGAAALSASIEVSAKADIKGHSKPVTSLAVLDDGNIASGTEDGKVYVWSIQGSSSKLVTLLVAHDSDINDLVGLSASRIATVSDDKTCKIWRLYGDCAECLNTLKGHTRGVSSVAVVPGTGSEAGSDVKELVITGGKDRQVRVWDAACGTCDTIFSTEGKDATKEGHRDQVHCVAYLGKHRLASGSQDKTVRVWDLVRKSTLKVLEGHSGGVLAVCPIGENLLASGSKDKTARVWDVCTGVLLQTLSGHTSYVKNVLPLRFPSRGGAMVLATASTDRTLRFWDEGGSCLGTLQGHSDAVNAVVALKGALLSGSDDTLIRIWGLPDDDACLLIP